MTLDPAPPTARVAVLIDCDNASWRKAGAVLAEAATHGVVGVKRGYGDWGEPGTTGWRTVLAELAIQPIQQIAYVTGKGATDAALIIDAMDLLYAGHVDTFCLVAGDSDYTRLAMRLREAGKRVVGIGSRHASTALTNACDRFTFVDVIGPEPGEATTVAGPVGVAATAPAPDPAARDAGAAPPPPLLKLLTAAILARREDDGWARLSDVGHHLVANHPTFDSRNYGFDRLGVLVRAQDFLHVRELRANAGNRVLQVRLAKSVKV